MTEIENMRHKVIESRQEIFNHNEHEVSKRWAFEEGVSVCVCAYEFKHDCAKADTIDPPTDN